MGFFDQVTTFVEGPEIELGTFDDELAYQIEWTPLIRGGTNFTTHRLIKSPGTSRDKVEVKTTMWCYMFCSLTVIFSVFMFFAILWGNGTWTVNGVEAEPPSFWPLFTLLPAAIGCGMLWWQKKKEGVFEYHTYTFTRGNQLFELDQVHAVQLTDEWVSIPGSYGYFRSYELNLVFNNCSRINILDHGSLGAIRQDSRMLSQFLRVPIWDVIGFRINPVMAERDPKVDILSKNLRNF